MSELVDRIEQAIKEKGSNFKRVERECCLLYTSPVVGDEALDLALQLGHIVVERLALLLGDLLCP